MRLSRYLAHGGVASRRAAEDLIRAGRVSVGGAVVTDPARDVDAASGVEVDGRAVAAESREVWALNKPLDVVSTASEPGRRRAVVELVDSELRLYPVGRLDADSTGLILLTNDGELANRLTHPRYGVPKTYRVQLVRPIADLDLERLRAGVRLEDGLTAPTVVERRGGRDLEITIREGRKRQVRRMAEAVGNEVTALERVRIGSLELGGLGVGDSRRLGEAEVQALWKDAVPTRANPHDRTHDMTEPIDTQGLRLWAVRGATKVAANDAEAIVAATTELLRELTSRNGLDHDRMVSCVFTSTDDLNAEFPAVAARQIGMNDVPLLCSREIAVPGSMPSVIRVLLHYYAPDDHSPSHTYLGEAEDLRSDLKAAQ